MIAVQPSRVPRVPYDLMVRGQARELRPGDYLPLLRRTIIGIEVTDDGALRFATRIPGQTGPLRYHVWRPSTPVLLIPKPG